MEAVMLICLVLGLLDDSTDKPAQPVQRPVTAYGLLYKEWKAEVEELKQAGTQLTGDEQRQRKRDINSRYTPRFLQLAKDHASDGDVWVMCMIWMTNEGVPGPDLDGMFDFLRENAHQLREDSTQLLILMPFFTRVQSDRVNPALADIAEKHQDKHLRGAALYTLAERIQAGSEMAGDLEGCKTAERLLERVLAEYPDIITSFGKNSENATQRLEELRSPTALGKAVPDFRGKTISGDEFRFHETTQGKVTLLSLSGHWCGPCVRMHPVQKEILSRFPTEKVAVIEINSDQEKSWDKVRAKLTSEGLNWIVVTDGGTDGPISTLWNLRASPTYILIDSQGKIRRRIVGNVGEKLIEWVDELVQED